MNARAVQRLQTAFVLFLGTWLTFSTSLVLAVTWNNRIAHAEAGMGAGLIILWIFLCGSLMYFFREPVRSFVIGIRLNWQLKFILFATMLAMLEEAITTAMTNLAPVFGVKVGQAYITASANYLDVILHHSVIVFVPWFVAWAWILTRYEFSPFWVFLLVGLNGLLAETLTFGLQHLAEFGLWIFVYGLMTYLPAYTIPNKRGTRSPKLWHGLLAFVMPFLFSIPWAILIHLLFPGHPDIHFPPITP
ncbi:MAG TPA: hypothetical protein VLZ89_16470 [Anaerolineales bacterium]|nr:hypothetical protein [Anaerolineales bacterium]